MSTVTDRVWRVALNLATEPGDARTARAVADYGPEQALDLWCATGSASSRSHNPGEWAVRAQHVIDTYDADGIRVVVPGEAEWPTQVSDMDAALPVPGGQAVAAPLCLWVKGERSISELAQEAVTVTGAGSCTDYGRRAAHGLGFELAGHGWTVVSTGAIGIDDAAHRGALLTGAGPTLAVLACGVDRPYPLPQVPLFERIAEAGVVISAWKPRALPQRHRGVYRRHLLAALTPGTVVVEAGMRCGALTTARVAHELGRVVMAVPGPVDAATSYGVHHLTRVRDGVRLVADARDVIVDLTTT